MLNICSTCGCIRLFRERRMQPHVECLYSAPARPVVVRRRTGAVQGVGGNSMAVTTQVERLADRIEGIVRDLGGSASHGELLNRLADEDTRGDRCLSLDGANVVLFVGMSELLQEAVH